VDNTIKRGQQSLFADIWHSTKALPTWVQVWLGVFLLPPICATLFFLDEPMGTTIAFLALLGVLPNMPIMLGERGFTKLMALPHILPWLAMNYLIVAQWPNAEGAYAVMLWSLAIVTSISIVFDINDLTIWVKGDRSVVGFDS